MGRPNGVDIMKLNFLVDNLGASQLSYQLINAANQLTEEGQYQIIVFFDQLQRHYITPNFVTMQIVEAWAQSGIGIATSLFTASKLTELPCMSPKFYYMWDLGMIRDDTTYDITKNILRTGIIPIVRHGYHGLVLRNRYNIESTLIVKDFNLLELKGVLDGYRTKVAT